MRQYEDNTLVAFADMIPCELIWDIRDDFKTKNPEKSGRWPQLAQLSLSLALLSSSLLLYYVMNMFMKEGPR